ncbi:MAG: PorV/PorQ family protein [candidate division KSB1 bacterium]|nr:PorV/PorQ family protein [candidate division KSB1 bacterium]
MRRGLCVLLLVSVAHGGQPGSTGFAVLKLTTGARAMGMAGAGGVTASDASAVYSNPAALTTLRGSEVYLSHNEWLLGTDHDAVAVAVVGAKQAWGVSVAHLAVGDIELRTGPSTEPLALVSAHEVVVGLSYARRWHPRVQFGATAKYVYSKIYLDTASGGAVDLGARYETGLAGMVCGVALRNLGGTGRLRDERIALPFQLQAGVALPMSLDAWDTQFLLASDLVAERGQTLRMLVGLEGVVRGIAALRVGYAGGYATHGLSAGLGLRSGRYRIDYAYTPFKDQLGATQQLSLSIGLGKR